MIQSVLDKAVSSVYHLYTNPARISHYGGGYLSGVPSRSVSKIKIAQGIGLQVYCLG
jgi:hypothetical protein